MSVICVGISPQREFLYTRRVPRFPRSPHSEGIDPVMRFSKSFKTFKDVMPPIYFECHGQHNETLASDRRVCTCVGKDPVKLFFTISKESVLIRYPNSLGRLPCMTFSSVKSPQVSESHANTKFQYSPIFIFATETGAPPQVKPYLEISIRKYPHTLEREGTGSYQDAVQGSPTIQFVFRVQVGPAVDEYSADKAEVRSSDCVLSSSS